MDSERPTGTAQRILTTAEKLKMGAGRGTNRSTDPANPGLFRPGKVVEMSQIGDYRHWLCVMECCGIIFKTTIEVTEREAFDHGHMPSFWTKKWRDAFAEMHERALRIEAGVEEPGAPNYLSTSGAARSE